MTDREAFEAFAKEKGIPFHWDAGTQEYSLVAWQTWQAATAHAQDRHAQAVLNLDRQKWFPSQRDFAEACVNAIRKGEG